MFVLYSRCSSSPARFSSYSETPNALYLFLPQPAMPLVALFNHPSLPFELFLLPFTCGSLLCVPEKRFQLFSRMSVRWVDRLMVFFSKNIYTQFSVTASSRIGSFSTATFRAGIRNLRSDNVARACATSQNLR